MVTSLFAALLAAGLAPGTAEGTLTLNGRVVALTTAYARFAGHGVEVALVDHPIPAELLDPETPLDTAITGRANGLLFVVTEKGAATLWSVTSSDRGGGGCGGSCDPALVFEPSATSDKEVTGHVLSRKVVDLMGHKVELDGRFRAEVRRYVEPKPANITEEAHRRTIREKGYTFSRRDFFGAAYSSEPDFFTTFIHAGMPVDARHPQTGRTLLMAVLDDIQDCDDQRARTVIGSLVALGTDPNQQEETGGLRETAVMKAYPCVEHMGRLLVAGAKLDAPGGWLSQQRTAGRELMDRAVEDGDAEVVDFLIRYGFDVKPVGPELLKQAAGKAAILKLIRAAGARGAPATTARPRKRPPS